MIICKIVFNYYINIEVEFYKDYHRQRMKLWREKIMVREIPDTLKAVLNEYVFNLKIYFGSKVYGVYIYNSVALGAFDEAKSDIDFITIINEEFTGKEIEALKKLHKQLNARFKFAKRLEGMYIRLKDIGKLNSEIKPYPYFADEKLKIGYYDINPVTWWTLKNYGIGVKSSSISNLNIEVSWKEVVKNMDYNLNYYWKGKLSSKIIFLSDYWIEFSVLTLCRILYTLKQRDITSKVGAAGEAVKELPDNFQLIVKEALRIRNCSGKKSLYKFRIIRAMEAKKFIEYVIRYCNNEYFQISNYEEIAERS